jgi:ATP-dependent DNA ligase
VNHTYDTLYSRTSTGAVQVWWMERDGAKYRSISGQKNGAKTTAEWTEAEPKNVGKANETSAEVQALLEVEAKYKKQLKSGYYKSEADIDTFDTFWPMLALSKAYKDYKHTLVKVWPNGIGVQTKYNGERMVLRRHGAFSRTGERFFCVPHIEEAFVPFFKKFPNAILDGEAFNYEKRERLNEIHSLMSKEDPTPEELQESKELIKFYIYDGFGFPSNKQGTVFAEENSWYLQRKAAIDNAFFTPCFKARYEAVVGFVPTWVVHSEAELEKLYQSFLEDKQEGAILRILDVGYQRKRCKYLLKYKPLDDEEYRIIAVQDGDGKDADLLSTVTCEKLDRIQFGNGDMTFKAKFKGTQVDARKAWKIAQTLIGKKATIHFNGKTAYGKPQFPRFDWNNWNKHN